MISQRDMVRASLLTDAHRETHRDVYANRRPRLHRDHTTVHVVTTSIRDLAVLLDSAGDDQTRAWLALRLRNRLDALDALLDTTEVPHVA